jgi:hypothetical protein
MKLIPILSTLLLIVLLTNCNKNSEKMCDLTSIINDTLNVSVNKSTSNNLYQFTVTIDSVLNDSRCPSNANCIWMGNAAVRFLFTNNDEVKKFVLNTNGGTNYPSDTTIDGYYIKLVTLSPYPEVNKDILQSEYVAELLIKKE